MVCTSRTHRILYKNGCTHIQGFTVRLRYPTAILAMDLYSASDFRSAQSCNWEAQFPSSRVLRLRFRVVMVTGVPWADLRTTARPLRPHAIIDNTSARSSKSVLPGAAVVARKFLHGLPRRDRFGAMATCVHRPRGECGGLFLSHVAQ